MQAPACDSVVSKASGFLHQVLYSLRPHHVNKLCASIHHGTCAFAIFAKHVLHIVPTTQQKHSRPSNDPVLVVQAS